MGLSRFTVWGCSSFGFVFPCWQVLVSHLCSEELLLLPTRTPMQPAERAGELVGELVCLALGSPKRENSVPWYRRNMRLSSCNLTIYELHHTSGLCELRWAGWIKTDRDMIPFKAALSGRELIISQALFSIAWPGSGVTEGRCWESRIWKWNGVCLEVGDVRCASLQEAQGLVQEALVHKALMELQTPSNCPTQSNL